MKKLSRIFLLLILGLQFSACGSVDKFFEREAAKNVTTVIIGAQRPHGFSTLATPTILVGGLFIYALKDDGSRQAGFLNDETGFLTMTLPNGNYTFYGVGWAATNLSSPGSSSTYLRCGTSAPVALSGVATNVALAMNASNCTGAQSVFAPPLAQSAGTITNLSLSYCSTYNTLASVSAGGGCQAGGATTFGSFRISMLTYGFAAGASPIVPNGGNSSGCIVASSSPGATTATSVVVPTSVAGITASPFATQLTTYLNNSCSGPSTTYTFPNGLANGSSNANSTLLGNSATPVLSLFVNSTSTSLAFMNAQAAVAVLGQSNFTTGGSGTTSSNLSSTQGVDVSVDGVVRVADQGNNRIMGFNATTWLTTGAPANFVLGQSNFTTAAIGSGPNQFLLPAGLSSSGTTFVVADKSNFRALIYNSLPTTGNPPADISLGASNGTTTGPGTGACTASTFGPSAVTLRAGKLVISDSYRNRVLIYNTLPTASGGAADIILGSASCAIGTSSQTFSYPAGAWTDGTKLAVVDVGNNRVLIWNSFPTASQQAADLELGQSNMTSGSPNAAGPTTASTLYSPAGGIWSNGTQLIVADTYNQRVMIWNRFPTTNQQSADVVLGVSNFTTTGGGTSANLLSYPWQLAVYQNYLLVTDSGNNRVLVFQSK